MAAVAVRVEALTNEVRVAVEDMALTRYSSKARAVVQLAASAATLMAVLPANRTLDLAKVRKGSQRWQLSGEQNLVGLFKDCRRGAVPALGALYGTVNFVAAGRIPNGAVVLLLFAVIVFLVGLISEQISSLRFGGPSQ